MSSAKDLLCPLPFNQVYLHSNGEVYPCSFTQDYSLGNVKDQSLMQIWQGDRMHHFRQMHLEGKSPYCNKNKATHFCHLHHERLRESTDFSSKRDRKLMRLDFMIDSFCNLKCVMCTNVLEDAGGFEHDDFWEHCGVHVFPYLKELEIIGGEPLIIKNTQRLVDMVTATNPECIWRVTTNAHYQLTDKHRAMLDKMKFESFAISVDSLKEDVFAKIRDGANLSRVLATLDEFRAMAKERPPHRPMKVVVNFVVQVDNAFELPSFIDFCRKKEVTPYPILLHDPERFSVLEWEDEKKEKLFDFYLSALKGQYEMPLASLTLKLFHALSPESRLERVEDLQLLKQWQRD